MDDNTIDGDLTGGADNVEDFGEAMAKFKTALGEFDELLKDIRKLMQGDVTA